jgi:hypothetical protein
MEFGKTYGPLPLGAWVALIGGGLGIALYSSKSKKPTVAVEDTSGVPGVGTGAQSLWVQNAPPAGSDSVADDKFTTNEEWARAAVNYLIAQGYDASLADTAVESVRKSVDNGSIGEVWRSADTAPRSSRLAADSPTACGYASASASATGTASPDHRAMDMGYPVAH